MMGYCSKHQKYMKRHNGDDYAFYDCANHFVVLKYKRLEYTSANISSVRKLIRQNLTNDLISHQVKKKYQSDQPQWGNPYFGLCVPSSFAFLYLMDTNVLHPVRGTDSNGEGHWWITDIETNQIFDFTWEQYPDKVELNDVYNSGKLKPYYGWRQRPASRFFKLITKVQPDAKLMKVETLDSLF